MKSRWTAMATGIVSSATLAMLVGQRLPVEALAVVVGVLAGVLASVPASLVVLWFAMRGRATRTPMDIPARAPAEPWLTLLAPPQPAPSAAGLANLPDYWPESHVGYAPAQAMPECDAIEAAHPTRRFTVVGGAELSDEITVDESGFPEEAVTWQR